MRFRIHDGACDALLPGAVGTLAGHPGGLGSRLTCGCGHADCPHPTPAPPPARADGDAIDDAGDGPPAPQAEPRVGTVWLLFAEDQLTEAKRAERGTLPVPEREPEVCPTCAGSRVVQLEAQRNEHRLVVDVVELPAGVTELTIPHGMAPEAEDVPTFYPPPADPIDFSQPVVIPGGRRVAFPNVEGDDDDAALADLAEYHDRYADGDAGAPTLCDAVPIDDDDDNPSALRCGLPEAHPGDHHHPEPDGPGWGWQRSAEGVDIDSNGNPVPWAGEPLLPGADDQVDEPLVPELIEVQCPACKGTGVAPPPAPPLIPNNPLPFRAGIRADLVERAYDRVDGAGGNGA